MSGVQALSRMPLLCCTRSASCVSRRSPLWVQPVVFCRHALASSSAGHVTSRGNQCQAAGVSIPNKCQPQQASFASSQLGLMPKRHSVAASAASSDTAAEQAGTATRPSNMYIALSILAVVVFGVANRVLYKMALVPLGNYVFFLAQLQTFGYVAVYFSALLWRYRAGIVTKAMLETPKKQFFLIGALEAAAQILGFIGAAKLPGVSLPLLQQSMMFWQIGLGYLLLGKRLAPIQFVGAAIVSAGVCTAAWPSQAGTGVLTQVSPMYAAIFVGSMFFPALATIFKEKLFSASKERLNGQSLDLFVVNSFGSAAQALFIFLLLPVISSLRGISISQLPGYLKEGTTCLLGGLPNCGSDCSGAPMLPLLYIVFNLGFNIAALNLLCHFRGC
ncbi:MAG: crt protein 1-like [Trebouxia sp. A1-2]|nr:MAG: crt protein 1-like [Trebouxia sp. A1-2]